MQLPGGEGGSVERRENHQSDKDEEREDRAPIWVTKDKERLPSVSLWPRCLCVWKGGCECNEGGPRYHPATRLMSLFVRTRILNQPLLFLSAESAAVLCSSFFGACWELNFDISVFLQGGLVRRAQQ